MPGTTPKGYPYAEPADPLVQWPATSKALAQKLENDLNLRPAGSIAVSGANWTPVVFPSGAYSAAPVVVVTPVGATPPAVAVRSVTIAGFEFLVHNGQGTAVAAGTQVNWIALGIR
jgi:hypothetical protein